MASPNASAIIFQNSAWRISGFMTQDYVEIAENPDSFSASRPGRISQWTQSRRSRNRVILVLVLDSSVFDYEDDDEEKISSQAANNFDYCSCRGFHCGKLHFAFLCENLCALCVKVGAGILTVRIKRRGRGGRRKGRSAAKPQPNRPRFSVFDYEDDDEEEKISSQAANNFDYCSCRGFHCGKRHFAFLC